ncbi:MAG TPA: homoaconitate hydratase, partial [Dictyoglomaceae bacterium]|nr:homoaconitate hydratase [Dictyoglomaceae bacterium]
KHSGTHALIRKFQEYAIQLSEEDAQELLKKVRALAVELKRPLFDKELMYLYQDYLKEKVGKEGV